MARIRTVKPDFWTDDKIGECSVSARLLFIASWNFSDDHGGLDRSAKQLKAQAFPHDVVDCEPLIQELLHAGLLIEYTVAGKLYLHIKNFRKHQKVEKPANPRIPLYEESTNTPLPLPDSSTTPHRGVAVSSLEWNGMEGNGVKRARTARPTKPIPRKRCPADFQITEALRAWALENAPDVDVSCETEKMRDWEYKTARTDWPACWRTWMRRAQETAKPINGHSNDLALTVWNQLIASEGAKPPRDARLQAAIDATGGWPAIRMRTQFDESKLRLKFCEAYGNGK